MGQRAEDDDFEIIILSDKKPRVTPPAPEPQPELLPELPKAENTPAVSSAADPLRQVGETALNVGATAASTAFNAASKLTTSLWHSEARQKAWESEQRKAVTATVATQAQIAAEAGKAKTKEVVDTAVDKLVTQRIEAEKEKLKTKVQETNWTELAQQTASAGLRGLSAGLAGLAAKLKASTEKKDAG
jgi:hypothetical protein